MPEAVVDVSVSDAHGEATARLAAAGCDNPRLDAELLLAEVLRCDRAALIRGARDELAPGALRRYEALIGRRAAREPVAYILGRKEFRRITLCVDRRVLIPRPETELLVDVGLSLAPEARVVDVGTGSGAVALALKEERPDLDVWATDASGDALAVARENARRLGVDLRFLRGDLLSGVPCALDAVLANLPYVASGEALEPEIALYEPAPALYAGADGLDVVRRLVPVLGDIPLVALEVAGAQARAVSEMLVGAGFSAVDRLRDLAGHERVVIGRR